MNFPATRAIWKYSRSTGTNRLVLLAIAYHMHHEDGEAYPSIATLAADVMKSERQVKRAIQELQESGELEVMHGQGRGNCNAYRIAIKGDTHDTLSTSKGDTDDTLPGEKKVTNPTIKGDISSTKGDISDVKGDTHDTRSKKEVKREVKREVVGATTETEKILRKNLTRLYDQLMLEVQERRTKWLELPPDRVRAIVRQAGKNNGGKFRTKLIHLLDLEAGLVDFDPKPDTGRKPRDAGERSQRQGGPPVTRTIAPTRTAMDLKPGTLVKHGNDVLKVYRPLNDQLVELQTLQGEWYGDYWNIRELEVITS
jgi:hypothetical protein